MCGCRKGYFSTQVLGLSILSPIFGTSNPGLNSSTCIAPLTKSSGKWLKMSGPRARFSWANKNRQPTNTRIKPRV